jgi:hypothetical protein
VNHFPIFRFILKWIWYVTVGTLCCFLLLMFFPLSILGLALLAVVVIAAGRSISIR